MTPITLPGRVRAVPHRVKCYRPGCRRSKTGYLSVGGTGQFYNRQGVLLADLREVDFACAEHGIVDGSAPFLYPDGAATQYARRA